MVEQADGRAGIKSRRLGRSAIPSAFPLDTPLAFASAGLLLLDAVVTLSAALMAHFVRFGDFGLSARFSPSFYSQCPPRRRIAQCFGAERLRGSDTAHPPLDPGTEGALLWPETITTSRGRRKPLDLNARSSKSRIIGPTDCSRLRDSYPRRGRIGPS